jgi:colanic acid/amylovoran biosynthesis glycosyltransferase
MGGRVSAIVYLANSFPEPGEPYVWEEIRALHNRGQKVLCCSFKRPSEECPELADFSRDTLYIRPFSLCSLFGAILLISRFVVVFDLIRRIIRGPEPVQQRLRTLAHTWLGASLAARLHGENVVHIHVHHGYFSAWAGMVAAHFLNATFTMTLHGSDLLVRADYLDCKLQNCCFCVTVSEFNREYIRRQYPAIDHSKILVHRLGVDLGFWKPLPDSLSDGTFRMLSVGRLHPVKGHEFLVRACGELKKAGVGFKCVIAGEGAEYDRLHEIIAELGLSKDVELRGRLPREQLPELYSKADVVVFTSRSEGIPIAAMEAMAMGRIVLAPAITGLPELITHGQTGFLYEPNSMQDFLAKLAEIRVNRLSLRHIRHVARQRIESKFDHQQNLAILIDDFFRRMPAVKENREIRDANPVLQQI